MTGGQKWFFKKILRLCGEFEPMQQWCLRSSWRLGAKLAPMCELVPTRVLKNWHLWPTGLQMVFFQTKNPNLSQFWRALPRMENDGIFDTHLVYFYPLWYIVSWKI
jgi:hypothetical protein